MSENHRERSARGIFISFEGGEGAGKTTHIGILEAALAASGREVLRLREPGCTALGESLRALLLDPSNEGLSVHAELFLYEAARAQLVFEAVMPALERGTVVLCDRFTDSTLAYQAYGRGLSADFVRAANEFACQGLRPDRSILMLPSSSSEGLARATRSGADRIEQAGEDFHRRVGEGFLELAAADPERFRVVRSCVRVADTAREVFAAVSDLLPELEGADEGLLRRTASGALRNEACHV